MSDDADTVGGCSRVPAALPEHVYVHVPVCRAKCSYCDFFSVAERDAPVGVAEIAPSLVVQAFAWIDRLGAGPAKTLYVGGGTPTVLPSGQLHEMIAVLRNAMCGGSPEEVTVEANPESLDGRTARMLADGGVTRISLGVQSFHDDALRVLGRLHDATRALAACAAVRDAGAGLAIDLICGVPGQSVSAWRACVEHAIETGAEHISVYPLSLESGTLLAAEVLLGRYARADDDTVADMMLLARDLLEAAGLKRYEVASYARTGHECRHNLAYWTGKEYIGIGPGAHGMLSAETARAAGFLVPEGAARVRYAVASDMRTGLGESPEVTVETLSREEALREDVMLRLRLVDGVPWELVEQAGVAEALERLLGAGLVERAGDRVRTTSRGWLLGNEVFSAVWPG